MGTIEKLKAIQKVVTYSIEGDIDRQKRPRDIIIRQNDSVINKLIILDSVILELLGYPQGIIEDNYKHVLPPKRPGDKGGRLRGRGQYPNKSGVISIHKRERTFNVICYHKQRQWFIGIEIPQDVYGDKDVHIIQGSHILGQDIRRNNTWLLESASNEIVAHVGKEIYNLFSTNDRDCAIFKLFSQKNDKEGIYVKAPSTGSYLVVAPEKWKRDVDIAGPPPYEPEYVSMNEYLAHYFIINKDDTSVIAFINEHGETIKIMPNKGQFELLGNCLIDRKLHVAPLFGSALPTLKASDAERWNDFGYIVIVKEKRGPGRKHWEFKPVNGIQEQVFPSGIAEEGAGWFSIRIYDRNAQLEDSMDFRYIRALKDIDYQLSILPYESGHTQAVVSFTHDIDCVIEPHASFANNVSLHREAKKTTVTIPSDYKGKEIRCGIESSNQKVPIYIPLDRVWWAIAAEDAEPCEWTDKIMSMHRKGFDSRLKQALWIQFPRERWVKKIYAGLEGRGLREYKPKVNEKTLVIPLYQFEIEQVADEERFVVQINETTAFAIKIVPKLECRFCGDEMEEADIKYHLIELHQNEILNKMYLHFSRKEIARIQSDKPDNKYLDPYPDNSSLFSHKARLISGSELAKKVETHLRGKDIEDSSQDVYIIICTCNQTFCSNSRTNTYDQLVEHQTSVCLKVRKMSGNIIPHHYKQIRLKSDLGLSHESQETKYLQCRLCKYQIRQPIDDTQLIDHLLKHHEKRLFKRI